MELLSKELSNQYGINFIDAYADKAIEDYFLQFSLDALLTPHKNLVTTAFKDYFDKVGGYRKHSSYQVNSKIRDYHEQLLSSKYNTNNNKEEIGIYNRIKRELNEDFNSL